MIGGRIRRQRNWVCRFSSRGICNKRILLAVYSSRLLNLYLQTFNTRDLWKFAVTASLAILSLFKILL